MTGSAPGPSLIDAAFAEEFARRSRRLGDTEGIEGILTMCTDDVEFIDATEESKVVGKEAVKEFWKPIFDAMDDVQSTVVQTFVGLDGTSIGMRIHSTVRRRGIEEPIHSESFEIAELRGDKACRWTIMIRQLDWMGKLWA